MAEETYTIRFGILDSETLEMVWEDETTGTYKTRGDAEWFAGYLAKPGEVHRIETMSESLPNI